MPSTARESPTFLWARNSPPILAAFAFSVAAARAARAQPIEIGGALVGSDETVLVRVDVRNTSDRRLTSVRVGGDLIGSQSEAGLGDLEPGVAKSASLIFPYDYEWRPGRHVLPLEVRFGNGPASTPPTDLRAYLVVQLATAAEPAVSVAAPEVGLDVRSVLPVSLHSADGRAHRVRLRVETPRGLVAPDPPPVVDVPAHGTVSRGVPLLWGAAPRDTNQGILVVAEALDGPIERMAYATTTVTIAPDPAWLPRLRAPLALTSLVLLGAGLVAGWRRARS
jgi:hypothetical protein